MSVASDLIDFWITDLTQNVEGLEDVTTHRYSPHSLEQFISDSVNHLAVWHPGATSQERRAPFTQDITGITNAINVEHSFLVLYWEPSEDAANARADEDASKELLDLAERMRARFLVQSNRAMVLDGGNCWRIDWTGTDLGAGGNQDGALVRSIAMSFTAQVAMDYS